MSDPWKGDANVQAIRASAKAGLEKLLDRRSMFGPIVRCLKQIAALVKT